MLRKQWIQIRLALALIYLTIRSWPTCQLADVFDSHRPVTDIWISSDIKNVALKRHKAAKRCSGWFRIRRFPMNVTVSVLSCCLRWFKIFCLCCRSAKLPFDCLFPHLIPGEAGNHVSPHKEHYLIRCWFGLSQHVNNSHWKVSSKLKKQMKIGSKSYFGLYGEISWVLLFCNVVCSNHKSPDKIVIVIMSSENGDMIFLTTPDLVRLLAADWSRQN